MSFGDQFPFLWIHMVVWLFVFADITGVGNFLYIFIFPTVESYSICR
jgi:hypothetical protein